MLHKEKIILFIKCTLVTAFAFMLGKSDGDMTLAVIIAGISVVLLFKKGWC